jgi:hypothetical protein
MNEHAPSLSEQQGETIAGDTPARPDFAALFPQFPAEFSAWLYDMGRQGRGDREIAGQLKIQPGIFKRTYGDVTKLAREHYPTAGVQRAVTIYQGKPLPAELGGGHIPPGFRPERLRELAAMGLPDRMLALGSGVELSVLNEPHIRTMIEEERLALTIRLVGNMIRAATGNENLLESIVDMLTDARDKGAVLDAATLQSILDLLSAERLTPNLLIGEKLLQRLGYFEAAMQGEIKVRVSFDPPPQRAEPIKAADGEVQGSWKLNVAEDVDS